MNLDVQPDDTLSPLSSFLFYTDSPKHILDCNDIELVSSFPSNASVVHHEDIYGSQGEPWYNLSEVSPLTDDDNFSPNSSISWNSVSRDESFLASLQDIPSPTNRITFNSSDEQCSSEENSPHVREINPEDSVTSKLKSVLMSRKRSREKECSISDGTKRKYEHRIEGTHLNIGGNKYYPNSSLRFPPCFVCGGTASGLHYGVNSCEPCKGFFTRYLRRKEDEYYKCTKDGNCTITNKLRGNCSSCRLQKCLSLGMSRKNSRLGRYSLSRRMETITQVNELENNSIDETEIQKNPIFNAANAQLQEPATEGGDDSNVAVDKNDKTDHKRNTSPRKPSRTKSPAGFSPKLVKLLVEFMESIKPYGEDLVTDEQIEDKLKSHYEAYQLKIEIFGNLKSVPKDEYFSLLKGFGIDIDKRMSILKQGANEIVDVIARYCNFAKQIPNFKSLSNRDQSKLLKSSRYDFFMILMHEGYKREYKCFLAHNGVAFHQDEVADKFFSEQLVMKVCDTYQRLQKLQLTKEEKALLIAISLLFTDRCNLDNPSLVEQIQQSLTQLLRNQLDITGPNTASRRFAKIIDCLICMRESSELYLQEYNQLCQDDNVIEEVPIMTEMLFEDK